MSLCTTRNQQGKFSLREAVLQGLAEDGGLYLPREIPKMPQEFFKRLPNLSLQEIGFEVGKRLLNIPENDLRDIIEKSLTFDAPIVEVKKGVYSLELFHGPTLSFKDFGARFMAQLFHYFIPDDWNELNILVATSGDTGSAVAHGFLSVPRMRVWILYPQGKISHIQEQQIATLGQNIRAIEVAGTFDDCQRIVKEAFLDTDLRKKMHMTSANSINIARLIPQSFYYFYAIGQVGPSVISVPSGNFGNLTGGLIAKRMGLPVKKFVAATNVNAVVPEYLETGKYHPRPSVPTLSNAMDVGNPSNFARIQSLTHQNLAEIREELAGAHFTDEQTLQAIHEVWKETGYLMDPHGAVAYLGLQEQGDKGIFLETAHPAKFKDAIEDCIGQKVPVPQRLEECLHRKKESISVPPDYTNVKKLLINQ